MVRATGRLPPEDLFAGPVIESAKPSERSWDVA